jgi:biotin synthase
MKGNYMDSEIQELIDRATDECLRGAVQSREVIIKLLSLDSNSEEVEYLKKRANEVAHIASGNKGGISGAIGVDLCSCDMNCKFCSFGTEWGLVKEEVIYTKEEIIMMAREYVEAGVTTLTLRSTEFYDMKVLTAWLHDIREQVAGDYLINLNVGEMTPAMAEAAYQAGATSAYHVIRLREGTDTPFDPELRKRTIAAIVESPLRWGTCLEPIGVEHTDEELADRILGNMDMRPHGMGVMFRVNVPGTPFEGVEPVSKERMLHILAAVRIAVGRSIRSLACHPAMPEALYAGGCGFTVERGANPRDVDFNETVWRGFTADEACKLIREAGFEVGNCDPDPRFRSDGTNWWHVDNPADYVMPNPLANSTNCCDRHTGSAD